MLAGTTRHSKQRAIVAGTRGVRGWEEGWKLRPKDRRLEREKMKYRP